jgi:hypothetical protein
MVSVSSRRRAQGLVLAFRLAGRPDRAHLVSREVVPAELGLARDPRSRLPITRLLRRVPGIPVPASHAILRECLRGMAGCKSQANLSRTNAWTNQARAGRRSSQALPPRGVGKLYSLYPALAVGGASASAIAHLHTVRFAADAPLVGPRADQLALNSANTSNKVTNAACMALRRGCSRSCLSR